MRKTTAYSNWDGSDSDYIDGKARNKTLSVTGTKWNEELMGDFLQCLLKACRDSGLSDASKNNLADNETNGYELFEALRHGLMQSKQDTMDVVGGSTYTIADDVGTVELNHTGTDGARFTVPTKIKGRMLNIRMNNAQNVDKQFYFTDYNRFSDNDANYYLSSLSNDVRIDNGMHQCTMYCDGNKWVFLNITDARLT